ncbi:MAG: hypothetical protein K2P98_02240 [Neisseriaceae bacterium]|nr:hypothetical protein [Neisseriaceae bacterium]
MPYQHPHHARPDCPPAPKPSLLLRSAIFRFWLAFILLGLLWIAIAWALVSIE